MITTAVSFTRRQADATELAEPQVPAGRSWLQGQKRTSRSWEHDGAMPWLNARAKMSQSDHAEGATVQNRAPYDRHYRAVPRGSHGVSMELNRRNFVSRACVADRARRSHPGGMQPPSGPRRRQRRRIFTPLRRNVGIAGWRAVARRPVIVASVAW